MTYDEYIASDHWRIVAMEAKQRAGWRCVLCGGTRAIEVHHNTYERLGREQASDLVVLCATCHRRHHGTLASDRRPDTDGQIPLPFRPLMPEGPDLN